MLSLPINGNCILNSLTPSDIDECVEGTDGCAQTCADTDGSYTCSCNSGYELTSNSHDCDGTTTTLYSWPCIHVNCYFSCIDIDECSEGTDGCDQLCSNNVGSYECVCNAGYRLGSDGFTCIGMLTYFKCVYG